MNISECLYDQLSHSCLTYFSQPNLNGVDQWGVMSGTYQEGSQSEEKEIYLRGIRQRRWGQDNLSTLQKYD